MQKTITTLSLLFLTVGLFAQYAGPRYFWDIPEIYLTTPNLSEVDQQVGLGVGTAFNIAGYWGTARIGGGSTFTVNPSDDDLTNSFLSTPYFLLEGGAGLYRTNGNKCAATNAHAFTAMGVLGLRYNLNTRDLISAEEEDLYGFRFGIGAELGYFYIRDVFRNTAFVLRATYFPKDKTVAANLGFKFFLNMREMGRR